MRFIVAVVAALVPAVSQAAFTDFTGLDGGGWTVDYQYHIQNSQNLSTGVPYDTNNSGSIVTGSFDRVAYVMEVQSGAGPDQYVFASFDALTFQTNASLLGVPTLASGETYQQNVDNLHVLAGGGAPVSTGSFSGSSGNVEFWPTDYSSANGAGVPGASNDTFDTGDTIQPGGYGSMQVSNHNANLAGNEDLISFNQWNGGGELGLGNQPTGNPDWTFAGNAGTYNTKDIQVLVHSVPEPASLVLLGLGAVGLFAVARRRRSA